MNWRTVAIYYGATFALTHLLSLGYVASGGSWGDSRSFVVLNVLMLCPGVVALVVQRWVIRGPVVRPLGIRLGPTRWLLLAWLTPPVIMIAALGLSLLLPGARYAPDLGGLPPELASFRERVIGFGLPPSLGMLLLGLALGPTLNAVGGLGEEIGWRGFVYKELAPLGFWRCSMATGALWALSHVPLFLEGYGEREHPVASALSMLAFVLLLAPILQLLRGRSGSVVACAVLHGTLGSTRLLSVAFVRDAGPWAFMAIPVVLVFCNVAMLRLVPCSRRTGDC